MIAPAHFDHSGRQGQTGYYLGVNRSPIGVNGDAGQAVSRQLQKRHTLIPKGRLTEKIELCLTSLNRGWLNAVAWELVPKILGRETEVTL